MLNSILIHTITLSKSTSYIQYKTRKIGYKVYSTLYYPILLIQYINPLNTLLTSLIFLSRRDVNLLMLRGNQKGKQAFLPVALLSEGGQYRCTSLTFLMEEPECAIRILRSRVSLYKGEHRVLWNTL